MQEAARRRGITVNMGWKYRFSHNGAKIHLKIVNSLLIKDLKSNFILVWSMKRILLPKRATPKALISNLFSDFDLQISANLSFAE